MHELIEGLLHLAQLGRQQLDLRPVDINALVGDVLVQLCAAGTCTQDKVQVDPMPVATGDAVLLRQVFANLLSNACKYSARNPNARVHVGCEMLGGHATYFVRDNGAGFDMTYAGRLFEPFQRMHGANEFAGLGVGLSIVRRVVMRHGGRVWAEAAVGEGACFRFTLAASPAGAATPS